MRKSEVSNCGGQSDDKVRREKQKEPSFVKSESLRDDFADRQFMSWFFKTHALALSQYKL